MSISISEDTSITSRPALVLPPPSNSQCADGISSEHVEQVCTDPKKESSEAVTTGESNIQPTEGADSTDPAHGNDEGTGVEEENVSPLQSLKRSLSDRSPARLNAEENKTTEEVSVDSANKPDNKQGDEPLIKRRNVALYANETEESAKADE